MVNRFNVGDRVKFLNSEGEGEVVRRIDDNKFLIENNYGFEEIFHVKDLLKFDSETDRVSAYRHISNSEEISSKKVKPASKNTKKKGQYWEVDLHIETILDRYNHLTNYEIVHV